MMGDGMVWHGMVWCEYCDMVRDNYSKTMTRHTHANSRISSAHTHTNTHIHTHTYHTHTHTTPSLTSSLIERVAAGSDEQTQHIHAVGVKLRGQGDGLLG